MFMKKYFKALTSAINTFTDWFDNKCGWFFCPPAKCGKEKQNAIYKKKY